jgi:hydrogenase maturation protease
MIFNAEKEIVGKKTTTISMITGVVKIEAVPLPEIDKSFRLTVTVTNTTPVANAERRTRDEVFLQSFLSTHIILQTHDAEFISHQETPAQWQAAMATCNNVNTWPILIDKNNSTLLSSPIILYDYPEINPVSSGDLFDSTEIEEALLLHVNLLSDEEKKRIGGNDEKLRAMLNKVGSLTPEDLIVYHSMMKDITPGGFDNK